MMISSILADSQDRFHPDCLRLPPNCFCAGQATCPKDPENMQPTEQTARINTIKKHFEDWGAQQSVNRLNQPSCGVAIYQVSNFDGFSSVEGGLAYLAHEQDRHHIFDGVLNVPVDDYKLKTPKISDYDTILGAYLENHFCDEAHLYMNLPNKGEFETTVETLDAAHIEKNVQAYFHENAIFQQALPALLRNRRIKKLVVHRVVGFTHASWGGLAEVPKKPIDKTEIYSEELADIFKKVHIMDPVEFDLEQYRKEQKIQICETKPDHGACTFVGNKEWHRVDYNVGFNPQRLQLPNLPYKTKGITNFIDSMFCGLAEEYQSVLQRPNTGKGAESFKSIWHQSQKKSPDQPYLTCVRGSNPKSPFSMDTDLTHAAAEEEWPSVLGSVSTKVKTGMCDAASASTYQEYVVGNDMSRLLPILALGIPFLMFR